MNEYRRESSTEATAESVAGPSDVPGWDAFWAWDRRTWIVAIPLILIIVYAFIPIVNNGFMPSLDDNQNFLENPNFRGLGPPQLKWAWTTFWVGAYQPLAWMLFGAQYVLCQLDPWGYHLTSLLFHVANGVVLYTLTRALLIRCQTETCSESPWTNSLSAGLATALFAVHPLRVEVVAWVSCQPYLPCALFSMLSVLMYLGAFPRDSSPHRGWLVGSFLLFVVAMLFKAVAVSLPVVLLILDAYPLRRLRDSPETWFGPSSRRALWEKLPFVMTSLLFMVLAIVAKPRSQFPVEHYSASEGIAQASFAIWFYMIKTLLPWNLIAFYPLPKELNWLAFPFCLSLIAVLVMSMGLFLMRRSWPGLVATWLSYLVILAPNSGIIRVSDEMVADRYSYISMLGAVALAAAGFCRLCRMSSRWHPTAAIGIIAIGVGLLPGMIWMTRNQCRTWLNAESLWAHALDHGAKSSYLAHIVLGNVRYDQRRYGEAAAHFTEAIRLSPGLAEAHNNLGNLLYVQGKHDQAVAQFTEALRLHPGYAHAHYNLGVALQSKGKDQAAAAHYAEAVRLRPDYGEAHKNLGFVLYAQGKHDEAVAQFTESLRLNPSYADARNSLGTILSRQGKYAEAEAHFTEALRIDRENVQAHYNLGNVFWRLGKYEEAKAEFGESMRLEPGFAEAYNAMALLMASCPEAKLRDGNGAVAMATRACELTGWKNAIVLDTLAAAQAEAGDFNAAVSSQQRAIEIVMDPRQKDEYRKRLELYRARKPYRQESRRQAPIGRRR